MLGRGGRGVRGGRGGGRRGGGRGGYGPGGWYGYGPLMLVDPYADIAFAVEAPYPDIEPMYRAVSPAMGSMYRWSDGYLEQAGALGTWHRLQRSAAVYAISRAQGRQNPSGMPVLLAGDEAASGIPGWAWAVGGIAALGMLGVFSRRRRGVA